MRGSETARRYRSQSARGTGGCSGLAPISSRHPPPAGAAPGLPFGHPPRYCSARWPAAGTDPLPSVSSARHGRKAAASPRSCAPVARFNFNAATAGAASRCRGTVKVPPRHARRGQLLRARCAVSAKHENHPPEKERHSRSQAGHCYYFIMKNNPLLPEASGLLPPFPALRLHGPAALHPFAAEWTNNLHNLIKFTVISTQVSL